MSASNATTWTRGPIGRRLASPDATQMASVQPSPGALGLGRTPGKAARAYACRDRQSPSPSLYEAPIRTALVMENGERPAHLRHCGRRSRRSEAIERAMPLMTVAVRERGARRPGVSGPTAAPDQAIERLSRAADLVVRHTKLHRNGHRTAVGVRSVDASILPTPRNKSPRSRHRR